MSDDVGIPPAARERLERLRDHGGPAFTSALGVGEALTVQQAGLRPLSQVMGTSYYKIGWQQMPWGSGRGMWGGNADGETQELTNQADAWNEARRLAVGRLREEAVAVGADAVVGVRVRRTKRDWATDLVEFVAVGTAVRSERYDLGPEPLLCNLSGQDVAKLVGHGFWPVGIVGGSTVAYVVTGARQQRNTTSFFGSGTSNQELPDYTQGLYDARALAMERLTRGAHELHAHGVVGVDVERSMEPYEREVNNVSYRDLIITMHILGTAIVEMQDGPPPPEKHIALPLS